MTFDPTSSLARAQDPESIRNFGSRRSTWTACTARRASRVSLPVRQTVDEGRTTFLTEEIPGSAAVSIGRQRAAGPARNRPVRPRSSPIRATTRT
jgi:hypothetical protein